MRCIARTWRYVQDLPTRPHPPHRRHAVTEHLSPPERPLHIVKLPSSKLPIQSLL
jgi:hypothetical protein